MKRIQPVLTFTAFLFLSMLANAQPIAWRIGDDYSIKFTSKSIHGTFRGLQVGILFDEKNPAASKIIATIDPKTIDTGIDMRDKHAKSESGLSANKFVAIKFESTHIVKTGNTYEASGKLSLKDISKDIKIPFTFETVGDKGLFKGKFTITPKEYDVTRSGTPEQVEIELVVPVSK